jgi:hypothetical protein
MKSAGSMMTAGHRPDRTATTLTDDRRVTDDPDRKGMIQYNNSGMPDEPTRLII